MRLVQAAFSVVLLAFLAGCVNDATGPTPTADALPSALGAGEAADANTQEGHR